jgi:hypothetical protein
MPKEAVSQQQNVDAIGCGQVEESKRAYLELAEVERRRERSYEFANSCFDRGSELSWI